MKIKKCYVCRTIADKYIVTKNSNYTKNDSKIIHLNNTGKFLWDLLLDGSSIEDLATALSNKFGISKEDAYNDAMDFVKILDKEKILEN